MNTLIRTVGCGHWGVFKRIRSENQSFINRCMGGDQNQNRPEPAQGL